LAHVAALSDTLRLERSAAAKSASMRSALRWHEPCLP
jgi:hypothetical protein